MNPSLKAELRRAILATGQLDIGEFYPEAFCDATRGGVAAAVNDLAATPHTKHAFVTKAGELVCVVAFGHN